VKRLNDLQHTAAFMAKPKKHFFTFLHFPVKPGNNCKYVRNAAPVLMV